MILFLYLFTPIPYSPSVCLSSRFKRESPPAFFVAIFLPSFRAPCERSSFLSPYSLRLPVRWLFRSLPSCIKFPTPLSSHPSPSKPPLSPLNDLVSKKRFLYDASKAWGRFPLLRQKRPRHCTQPAFPEIFFLFSVLPSLGLNWVS